MGKRAKVFMLATATAAAGALYLAYDQRQQLNQENFLNDYILKRKDFPSPRHQISNKDETAKPHKKYVKAVALAQKAVQRVQHEMGVPGMVVGVSVDGHIVWNQGFGMANVETQTPCHSGTKMRIASISKPITMTLLAKLVEAGLVDLNRPIQEYVPYYPEKRVKDKTVTVTPRLVACHMAGIRHYHQPKDAKFDDGAEFYLKDEFKNVPQSVELFLNDDLLFEPGTEFLYTTHGYTLLSAVIEGASKKPFTEVFQTYFRELGLKNTHLDEIPTIVYDRASYYTRNQKGRLKNAKLTDNSYKWAGGGLVSTTGDLLKFANIMLASAQNTAPDKQTYLKAETIKELWTPVPQTKMSWSSDAGYGLGWTVVPSNRGWLGGEIQNFRIGHGGGAVGASSVLLIEPSVGEGEYCPRGVAVAIIANLQNVSFYKLATEILESFRNEQMKCRKDSVRNDTQHAP